MEARWFRAAAVAAVVWVSAGARFQTPNFIVETPDARLAEQFGRAAEAYRRDLAVEWLGEAMPNWSAPCPITVQVGPQLGAGGATTFVFDRGEVFGWRMSIQGSAERIVDSVLPHEITHMIFASRFRQPLPRWADEGGATSVEHVSERNKHRRMLYQFLQTGRGIAFNRMFAMREYPADVMPLYAQGYSVAEYLIQTGGRRKYVEFLGDGLKSNDWPGAVRRHYGTADLGQLQTTWLAWVRQGSPALKPRAVQPEAASPTLLAADQRRPRPEPNLIHRVGNEEPAPYAPGSVIPAGTSSLTSPWREVAPAGAAIAAADARPAPKVLPSDGWHAAGERPAAVAASVPAASDPLPTQLTRPQPIEQPRQIILEWNKR